MVYSDSWRKVCLVQQYSRKQLKSHKWISLFNSAEMYYHPQPNPTPQPKKGGIFFSDRHQAHFVRFGLNDKIIYEWSLYLSQFPLPCTFVHIVDTAVAADVLAPNIACLRVGWTKWFCTKNNLAPNMQQWWPDSLTHICAIRRQWVNIQKALFMKIHFHTSTSEYDLPISATNLKAMPNLLMVQQQYPVAVVSVTGYSCL